MLISCFSPVEEDPPPPPPPPPPHSSVAGGAGSSVDVQTAAAATAAASIGVDRDGDLDLVHAVINRIVALVPRSIGILTRVLNENFPHKSQSLTLQVGWLSVCVGC